MLHDNDPQPPVNAAAGTDRSFAWFPATLNLACPLLEAMPFPLCVSSHLKEVQQFVAEAVDVAQPIDIRSAAYESARHKVRYCGMAQAELLRFRLALLSLMKGTEDSAQTAYAHIQAQLEECECSVVTATSASSQPCPPFVEFKKGSPKLDLPRIALQACEKLLAAFLSKDLRELKRCGANECTACILILELYLQHGVYEKAKDSKTVEKIITLRALQSLWSTLLRAIPKSFKADTEDFSAQYGEQAYSVVMHRISAQATGLKANTAPWDMDSSATNNDPQAYQPSQGFHLVVPGDIPPATDSDVKEIIQRLSNLKSLLPLVRLPSTEKLDAIRSKLLNEFPWAAAAIDAITGELLTRKRFGSIELSFSPILLLGPPGVGKTRLVRRLAEEVGMPFLSLGLAAMDDSRSLLGTSRGWGTAQPAPLIEFLFARNLGSALMLLDEIDKVTHRSANSTPPTTALLSLLEQENARNFFDCFLQTRVDLSKVCFVATANTVDGVLGPLLSRMRTCVVGRPTPSQMASTIGFIATDVAKD